MVLSLVFTPAIHYYLQPGGHSAESSE